MKNDKLGKSVVLLGEERFRGIKDNRAPAMFMLFHELGHCIYDPVQRDPAVAKKYHRDREKAIAAGEVIKEERMADEIAADYLGCDVAIEGLEFLSFNTCVVLVSIGIILNRCDSFFDFHQDFPDFLPFPFPVIINPAFSLLAHTTTSSSNESFI